MSESIYSWIKQEAPAAVKPERYKSTFDPTAPVPASHIRAPKKAAATMGRHVKDTITPAEFLKTRERTGDGLPEGNASVWCVQGGGLAAESHRCIPSDRVDAPSPAFPCSPSALTLCNSWVVRCNSCVFSPGDLVLPCHLCVS